MLTVKKKTFQILIMIVVMIRTNQRICVVSETVQQVGNGVPVSRIIDAFQNGCSAMERMTVETTGLCSKLLLEISIC